jgi:cbb3-type cytochrome oxidase subunit 3
VPVIVADFDFLDAFWLLVIFLPLLFMWIFALATLFRSIGHESGLSIALWLLAIILLPALGSIFYLWSRHGKSRRDDDLVHERTESRDHYVRTIG